MYFRRLAVPLLSLFLFCVSSSAQAQPLMPSPNRVHTQLCSLSGRVTGADGKPAAGVRIEVRDARSAMVVDTTSTKQDGRFEVNSLRAGSYEVVAQAGPSDVRSYVTAQFGEYSVDLRLPANTAPGYGSTVSIAAMMVPVKARDAYNRARQGFAAGKPERAQKDLDRALQLYPHFAEALTMRGIIEMQGSQVQAAQQDLEEAIRNDGNYGPAYTVLGAIYNAQGRFDDALRTLDYGTAVSPGIWQTYFELAKASMGKKQYQEGLQFAARAEQLSGNGVALLHLLKANAMIPLKLYEDAKRELEAYLRQEPNGKEAERAHRCLAELQAAEETTLAATQ